MNRFLTLWNKDLVVKKETPAAPRPDTFAQTAAAVRQALGKTESRIIPFRCAQTGKRFFITFERFGPAHRFQIVRIDKEEDSAGPTKAGRRFFPLPPAQTAYDANEFDCTGRYCPWCGDDSTVVHCGECGETVCGARVRELPDGRKVFACHDGCGNTGETEPCDRIYGNANARQTSNMAGKATRRPAAPKHLPGSTATPLLGRRKT